jgi:hypothetical protein
MTLSLITLSSIIEQDHFFDAVVVHRLEDVRNNLLASLVELAANSLHQDLVARVLRLQPKADALDTLGEQALHRNLCVRQIADLAEKRARQFLVVQVFRVEGSHYFVPTAMNLPMKMLNGMLTSVHTARIIRKVVMCLSL